MKLHTALLVAAIAFVPSALVAQSVSVHLFTASMSASNENPALEKAAFADGLISIKATRSSSGALTQAVVDFNVDYFVGQPEMIVAMHIHRGAAGVNGPVVINSGLQGPLEANGDGVLFYQMIVTDADMLATVEAILQNPAGYYLNAHSTSAPPGFIRGQLQRTTLSMIQMNSAQSASIEAKVDALKATLDRIANRLGVVPVTTE